MKKIHSLRLKILCSIVLMVCVISSVLLYVSYATYKNTMDEHYTAIGDNIARTTISLLDAEAVADCVRQVGTADPEVMMASPQYQDILATMRKIKDSNNVLYLYMIYPTESGSYFIFDTDTSEEACPYGFFMEYYEGSFSEIVDELLAGEMIPAVISNEEYGWIISNIYPYVVDGELLGYVCSDLSMDNVVMDRQNFLLKAALIISAVTLIFAVAYNLIFNVILIQPIRSMTNATSRFVQDREDETESTSPISALRIETGDELQQLCVSLKKMEGDLNTHIENLKHVTAEKERIGAELDVATKIQRDMMPSIFPGFPEQKEFAIYATMDTAKEVGGDFYDFFMIDDSHIAVVMADVSGKGVPAALFMVIAKTVIKNQALAGDTVDQVFMHANDQLCENNGEGLFVTAFMGVLDLKTGEFTYVNAGHNAPLLRRKGGEYEYLEVDPGFVLAGFEGMPYSSASLTMAPGDSLYLYTDGVTEALNTKQEFYGEERLKQALNAETAKELGVRALLPYIRTELEHFAEGAEQADDITMLALTYYAESAHPAELNGGVRMKKSITVPAQCEQLDVVQGFINEMLEGVDCDPEALIQLQIAAEEIFVNIAHYAYKHEIGTAEVECQVEPDEGRIMICFKDQGVPFDPLAKEDADVNLSAEEREIGGLGIYMVKDMMDGVSYVYENGSNILTIHKKML